MQVWEVIRVSPAPSKLALSLSVGYTNNRTILALTYLRHERSGVVVLPGASLSSHEGTAEPKAYAAGQQVSCTTPATACTETRGANTMLAYYNDDGLDSDVAPDTVLVVTYGRDAKVAVTSGARQWRLRRVSRTARAVWSSDQSSTAGLWSGKAGVEAFTTASAKGGRRGSVAIGVPPCAGTPVGITAGAGSVTLTGGIAPVSASCPQDVLRPSQVARRATTWRLDGRAAGLTAELVSEPGTVRLLVVDS